MLSQRAANLVYDVCCGIGNYTLLYFILLIRFL